MVRPCFTVRIARTHRPHSLISIRHTRWRLQRGYTNAMAALRGVLPLFDVRSGHNSKHNDWLSRLQSKFAEILFIFIVYCWFLAGKHVFIANSSFHCVYQLKIDSKTIAKWVKTMNSYNRTNTKHATNKWQPSFVCYKIYSYILL